jgi:hypothetical protein
MHWYRVSERLFDEDIDSFHPCEAASIMCANVVSGFPLHQIRERCGFAAVSISWEHFRPCLRPSIGSLKVLPGTKNPAVDERCWLGFVRQG